MREMHSRHVWFDAHFVPEVVDDARMMTPILSERNSAVASLMDAIVVSAAMPL